MTAPLTDQLHEMTVDELTQFFAARPELAEPPPADLRSLAERANAPFQINQVMRRLDGLALQLVHALAWFDGRGPDGGDGGVGSSDAPGGWTSVAHIEALAAEAPPPGAVAAGLARLRRLGIAGTRADGRWTLVAPIAEGGYVRPFGLGPHLGRRLQRYSLPELQVMARNLGLDENGLKGMLVDRIAGHLSTQPGFGDAVRRGAPGSAELLMLIDSIGGTLGDLGGSITREGMGELRALVSLGLLMPFGGGGFIIPAEIQLVMRGGFPLEQWIVAPADPTRLDEPDSSDPHSGPGRFDNVNIFRDPDEDDGEGGLWGEVEYDRANRAASGRRSGRGGRDSTADTPWSPLVSLAPGAAADVVARIGLRWRDAAVPALKTGGLGVKELRALAGQIGADERTTARLVELGALAGLLGMRVEQPAQLVIPQGRRRPVMAAPIEVLGPTRAFADWVLRDPATRWWSLVRTWWSTPWDVSRAGRPYGDAAKPIAAMSWAWEQPGDLPTIRRRVFEALVALDPGTPIDRSALVAHVTWFEHEPFAERDLEPLETVVDVLREAALLGLISDDGSDNLTTVGLAVAASAARPEGGEDVRSGHARARSAGDIHRAGRPHGDRARRTRCRRADRTRSARGCRVDRRGDGAAVRRGESAPCARRRARGGGDPRVPRRARPPRGAAVPHVSGRRRGAATRRSPRWYVHFLCAL